LQRRSARRFGRISLVPAHDVAESRQERPARRALRAARQIHQPEHARYRRLPGDTEMKSPVLVLLASAALFGQGGLNPAKLGAPPTDSWPTYNGDYSGRRYSTLSKINQSNINSLSLAWVRRVQGQAGGFFGGRISSTPLQVNGVLYFTMPDHVWAVDA